MGGSHEAVEALYHQLGAPLLAYARSFLRDGALAEDAVHQVFLNLLSGRATMPDEPRPYLFRAVRNASLNRLRMVSRERAEAHPDPMFVAPGGLNVLVPDLESALAALPDEQREVVVLRIWGGLTIEAAARVAGVSPNTAASRYRYGLSKLRERFGTHVR